MASNSFGELFRITTWGESHGPSLGVVIDGCPAGLVISEEEIAEALLERASGRSPFTSPRKEADRPLILSGLFQGKTTGAPISLVIHNKDHDSSQYDQVKDVLRPGHANFTYLEKYKIFDYRGGGRASARETAARVMGGVVAQKLLAHYGVEVLAYISQIGGIEASSDIREALSFEEKKKRLSHNILFCPDHEKAKEMQELLHEVKKQGDSVGGVVSFETSSLPKGWGDPVYQKLEARLAYAMLSIPASKGFEIGEGFLSATLRGSQHNDSFVKKSASGEVVPSSNHAGGVLGGISSGASVYGRVAFKPTSSIMSPQETLDVQGRPVTAQLPETARHDPCVAIRGVAVVKAMVALVLADALLMNRSSLL